MGEKILKKKIFICGRVGMLMCCRGISIRLANNLGQQTPGCGVVCYRTTDKLMGRVSHSFALTTHLDGRSRAGGLLLVLFFLGQDNCGDI